MGLFTRYDTELKARWEKSPLLHVKQRESEQHPEFPGLKWKNREFLPAHAEIEAGSQMGNPIKVLTSGVEAPVEDKKPFEAGGKWRVVERKKWWEDYDEPIPVIVGHYWRRYSQTQGDEYGPDLFDGIEPHQWMGKHKNVYCVDFSVGGRALARLNRSVSPYLCKLSGLRVPGWEVCAWSMQGEMKNGGKNGAKSEAKAHRLAKGLSSRITQGSAWGCLRVS